jgi:hypothetical protein
MNKIEAYKIVLDELWNLHQGNDYFNSGDKDTKFHAFESIIGKSVYDLTQEEVNKLSKEKEVELDKEYERLCEVGKTNEIFYNKCIEMLNWLIEGELLKTKTK